jgi:hypothetical protein
MKKKINFTTSLTLFILFFQFPGFGQIHPLEKVRDKSESLNRLENELIRREIETFTVAKYESINLDTLPAPKLREIPLLGCSGNYVLFEAGNWISTNLHVSIESKPFVVTENKITYIDSAKGWVNEINDLPVWGAEGEIPKNQITEVKFWFHIHWPQELPASAFAGLYEPNFCSEEYHSSGKGKQAKPEKQFCKVYQSEDKKRVYIYMKNSSGFDGYEVTWVIENGEYLMRVIDSTF